MARYTAPSRMVLARTPCPEERVGSERPDRGSIEYSNLQANFLGKVLDLFGLHSVVDGLFLSVLSGDLRKAVPTINEQPVLYNLLVIRNSLTRMTNKIKRRLSQLNYQSKSS